MNKIQGFSGFFDEIFVVLGGDVWSMIIRVFPLLPIWKTRLSLGINVLILMVTLLMLMKQASTGSLMVHARS
jgi:hypothetical protein